MNLGQDGAPLREGDHGHVCEQSARGEVDGVEGNAMLRAQPTLSRIGNTAFCSMQLGHAGIALVAMSALAMEAIANVEKAARTMPSIRVASTRSGLRIRAQSLSDACRCCKMLLER